MVNTGKFKNLGLNENHTAQTALLTAIARSAEDLTNGRGWPNGVNELMASLGKITKVSRVWIFQVLKLTDKYVLQDYAFEWSSKKKYVQINLPSFNRFKTYINEPDYAKMIKSRLDGEYQNMIVSELEPSFNKKNLENQNVKSMLTIPIFVENKWWGVLGFDDCEREYKWSDSEIALLRTAAFLISSAILRDKLSAKRKQLDILQEITVYSVWEFDIDRKYLWYSSEIVELHQKKTDNLQLSFKNMLKIIHKKDRKRLFLQTKKLIKNSIKELRCDVRILTNKNVYKWIELIGKMPNNSKSNKLTGIAVDISERKETEKKLQKEATTDPLTNTLNRRSFEQIMESQFKLNDKEEKIISFLLLDIDFFKKVNDTYGHPIGDKVLIHIVNICKDYLRKDDYLARMGGEEFAILLPYSDNKEARMIAERIRKKVQETPFMNKEKPIYCTISIGFTTSFNVNNTNKIYDLADLALYHAKSSGRNKVYEK